MAVIDKIVVVDSWIVIACMKHRDGRRISFCTTRRKRKQHFERMMQMSFVCNVRCMSRCSGVVAWVISFCFVVAASLNISRGESCRRTKWICREVWLVIIGNRTKVIAVSGGTAVNCSHMITIVGCKRLWRIVAWVPSVTENRSKVSVSRCKWRCQFDRWPAAPRTGVFKGRIVFVVFHEVTQTMAMTQKSTSWAHYQHCWRRQWRLLSAKKTGRVGMDGAQFSCVIVK